MNVTMETRRNGSMGVREQDRACTPLTGSSLMYGSGGGVLMSEGGGMTGT